MLSIADFATKIKTKYPTYQELDDFELVDRIVKKYPVYKEQVDVTELQTAVFPEPPSISEPSPDIVPETVSAPATSTDLVHKMPDGTTMAGPEHPGVIPDSTEPQELFPTGLPEEVETKQGEFVETESIDPFVDIGEKFGLDKKTATRNAVVMQREGITPQEYESYAEVKGLTKSKALKTVKDIAGKVATEVKAFARGAIEKPLETAKGIGKGITQASTIGLPGARIGGPMGGLIILEEELAPKTEIEERAKSVGAFGTRAAAGLAAAPLIPGVGALAAVGKGFMANLPFTQRLVEEGNPKEVALDIAINTLFDAVLLGGGKFVKIGKKLKAGDKLTKIETKAVKEALEESSEKFIKEGELPSKPVEEIPPIEEAKITKPAEEIAEEQTVKTLNVLDESEKSIGDKAVDIADEKYLSIRERLPAPKTDEEILNPVKALENRLKDPDVPDDVRQGTMALVELTKDDVMGIQTRVPFVTSVHNAKKTGRDFAVFSLDDFNLGGENDFFKGKVPDKNGDFFGEKWIEKHPEFKGLKGEEAANVVLRKIANKLREKLKKSKGELSRTGGDEKMALALDISLENAELLAKELKLDSKVIIEELGLDKLPHPKHGGMQAGGGHVNIGVVHSKDFDNVQDLINEAGVKVVEDKGLELSEIAKREGYTIFEGGRYGQSTREETRRIGDGIQGEVRETQGPGEVTIDKTGVPEVTGRSGQGRKPTEVEGVSREPRKTKDAVGLAKKVEPVRPVKKVATKPRPESKKPSKEPVKQPDKTAKVERPPFVPPKKVKTSAVSRKKALAEPIKYTGGKEKFSKAFKNFKEKVEAEIEDAPTYQVVNLKQNLEKAFDFVAENPKRAERIARGIENPPEGVLKNYVSHAVSSLHKSEGNIEKLVSNEIARSLDLTRKGQEIASQRKLLDKNSAEYFINQVIEGRLKRHTTYDYYKGSLKPKPKSSLIKRASRERIKIDRKAAKVIRAQNILDSILC